MSDRPAISEQFAAKLREASAVSQSLAESVVSIKETVIQTRAVIADSRRLLDEADKVLSR